MVGNPAIAWLPISRNVAQLIFYAGTMDSGKSTLALQAHHNQQVRGRRGLVLTRLDRAGDTVISSRLGISVPAVSVADEMDLFALAKRAVEGDGLHYMVCDEVQFYSPLQVEQLADVVDHFDVEVLAFGILTDFRSRMFPATARLVELADRIITPAVPALCWCGKSATHQARLVNGVMMMMGETVVVGDVASEGSGTGDEVVYVVLCRAHYRSGAVSPA
jgi:thymidine kinase